MLQYITKVTSFSLGFAAWLFHTHLSISASWFSVTMGRRELDFPRCRVSWSDPTTVLCLHLCVFTGTTSAISCSVSCSGQFLCDQRCILKLNGQREWGFGVKNWQCLLILVCLMHFFSSLSWNNKQSNSLNGRKQTDINSPKLRDRIFRFNMKVE